MTPLWMKYEQDTISVPVQTENSVMRRESNYHSHSKPVPKRQEETSLKSVFPPTNMHLSETTGVQNVRTLLTDDLSVQHPKALEPPPTFTKEALLDREISHAKRDHKSVATVENEATPSIYETGNPNQSKPMDVRPRDRVAPIPQNMTFNGVIVSDSSDDDIFLPNTSVPSFLKNVQTYKRN